MEKLLTTLLCALCFAAVLHAQTPTPELAYISNAGSNNVSVINTATNTVIATITVGVAPGGVSVSPNGSRVYVANYTSNNVSIINTATNTVIATIAVGTNPFGVSVSPDGSQKDSFQRLS